MEYTKGEWKASEYDAIRVDFDKENCAILCGDNSGANAHLIAAAPDMYELLKEIRNADLEMSQAMQAEIELTILKAEGK